MARRALLLAALAAYLPASSLPVLASRADLPGGAVDPALLVVPFCLGFAVAFPAWGRLADRRGARAVIGAALLALLGAGLVVALAGDETTLVAGRALQGLAAAGVPPAVQAELARGAEESRAGRALSGMMLTVAVASLGGPALAHVAAEATGWTATALLIGCAGPALLLVALTRRTPARPVPAIAPVAPVAAPTDGGHRAGVLAGWVVSACVLGGHWTVLTRLEEALGPHGLGAPSGVAGLASLAGIVGLPLVVLAARACDRIGPRRPMVATLLAGAAGFALAAVTDDPVVFVAASGLGLAVYWAYLPVVAVQVQRSAAAAARGRAAGGLYASMWSAAALAGAAASLAPSWRVVLAGAAVAWAVGAVVAWRGFLSRPAVKASSVPWATSPRPSLR